MTDRDALYATILSDPADDTARFVLADLLREFDDPDEQARGRFLWAGVTTARYRDHDLIEDSLYYTALREIEAVSSAGFPARWVSALGIGPQPLTKRDWAWDCTLDRVGVRLGSTLATYTRGLLSEVSVTLEDWHSIATAALVAWPLEVVHLTEAPGLSLVVESVEGKWYLKGVLRVPKRRVLLGGGELPATMAPLPHLVESAAEWSSKEVFPTRQALVEAINSGSTRLVVELREAAGDRWPRPARRRR